MKNKLLLLSALLCCAIVIMYILVKGAEPDRIFTAFTRNYNKYQLQPVDTIEFPGRVSIMKTSGDNIYGYVYSKNAIFRYNTSRHTLDTFLVNKTSIITRMEIEPVTNTFYLFDDTGNNIVIYQPDTAKPAVNGTEYLSMSYDTIQKRELLKLKNFAVPQQDSILYPFPRFEDDGLSADGFYIRNMPQGVHFYIPFYHSGIIRYDVSHNNLTTFHTIDNTPPVNIAVQTGDIYTRSSKAIVVNSSATADQQYLYILSYVLSKDVLESGYRGPAIDVYNSVNGQYEGSFRLPGYQSKPVLQLSKRGDTLIAAYESNILLFKLRSL